MFALEAVQAGFNADCKILELNTFGGLYTKYLNDMPSCLRIIMLTFPDQIIDNKEDALSDYNYKSLIKLIFMKLCSKRYKKPRLRNVHDFSRLLEQLLIFLSTFNALNFQPFLTL
ncbi:hypothetical protein T03_1717 [Trichinella britovi]|uniref:Uncharacterized protein n=1 Tax=Trichinella britovi TaxID=45882 RepID=A0A0V1C5N1_TRIBR|nr:hypothetical protein T03_1717 [Trichinella britovi]